MEKPQKYTNFLAKKSLFLFIFLLALAPISFLNAKDISIGTTAADKVGIGTASPAAKLQINPASSMQGLIIKSSDQSPFIIKNSSDSEIFRVDQNGNITSTGSFVGSNNYWGLSGSKLYVLDNSWSLGIGTTSPADVLHVVKANGANILISDSTNGTYPSIKKSGSIKFLANVNTADNHYASIESYRSGSGYADQTDLRFFTQNSGSSSPSERMRISDSGNIGIGTSNPGSDKLVVNGGRITTLNGYNMFSAGQMHAAGTGRNFLYGNLGVNLPGSGGVTNLAVSGNASIGASYTNTANVPSPPTNGLIVEGNTGIGTANPGTYKLNVVGNTYINGTLTAKSITDVKRAINSVSTNIGTPTVEEMALFHGQFNNKFRFFPATLQEESTDGNTWVTSTRLSTNQLADLMLGEGQTTSATAIPAPAVGGSGYYRLTWDAPSYMLLNAFYAYNSTSGNQVNFKIEAYHNTNGWTEITNGTISNWPGHTYIPHNTIYFNPTNPTQSGKVRVTFSITSATYANPFTLYGIEWFGGYPAGMRNVQSYDRDKNVTFPSAIKGGSGSASVPTFSFASDSDTGMYTGGSNIIRFSTGGSDKMTIFSDGSVGIGSTSPAYKLSVVGSGIMLDGNTGNANIIINDIANRNASIKFNSAGVTQWSIGRGDSDELPASSFFIGTGSTGGASSKLVIDSSGNVGIGTTNPLDTLHVSGNVRVSGLLNCSGTGAAIKTDASGRLVCGTISGGVTGSVSGTTNYLAKWTGTNTLGNTVIYDNGTNVGIGTTTPAAKLQINPQTGVEGLRIISSNYSPLVIRDSTNSNDYLRVYQWGLVNTPRGLTANDISVYPGYSNPSWNYDSLYIGNHGWYSGDELGIVEQYNGYNLITHDYGAGSSGKLFVGNSITEDRGTGNVGIGTTNPLAKLDIFGPSGVGSTTLLRLVKDGGYGVTEFRQFYGSVSNYGLDINSGQFVINKGSGNVGVGTTNPGTKLDVNGSINLTSSGKLGFGGVNTNWMDFTSNYFRLLMGGSGAAPIKVGGLVVSGDYGATAPTTGAYIQGNLGVGVSNPAQKLTISGASLSGNTSQTNISAFTGNGLRINGSIGDSSQDAITYQSGSAGAGAAIAFGRDGSYGTFISMYTNPTTSGSQGSIVERLRVTQNGNVGIGTTDPQAKLDVASAASILLGGSDATFRITSTANTLWLQGLNSARNGNINNIAFSGYNGSNRTMDIDIVNQRVGIGTASPGSTLSILKSSTSNNENTGGIEIASGAANTNAKLILGTVGDSYSYIQSMQQDYSWTSRPLSLMPNGGTVGIGTTNPQASLDITTNNGTASLRLLHNTSSNSRPWRLESGNGYSVDSFTIKDEWNSASIPELIITPGGSGVTGKIGIGTTTIPYKLTVAGDVGASAFNYTSDRSLKKNIKTISNPVDKIMKLRGVSFNWKDNGQASLGLIAQEVEKVFPELVTGDSLKSVQYGNLVAPLIEAVKEQQREIELLNKRIEALEAKR